MRLACALQTYMFTDNVPQLAAIEQKSDYMIDAVPSVIPASIQQPSLQLQQVICSSTPNRNVSVELISNKAVKFKVSSVNSVACFLILHENENILFWRKYIHFRNLKYYLRHKHKS